MANKYYTVAGKTIANLDESDETDVNDVNTAVEAACDLIEADIDALVGAREWAITPVDTLVPTTAGGNGVDDYSALHHATKALAAATFSLVGTVLTITS